MFGLLCKRLRRRFRMRRGRSEVETFGLIQALADELLWFIRLDTSRLQKSLIGINSLRLALERNRMPELERLTNIISMKLLRTSSNFVNFWLQLFSANYATDLSINCDQPRGVRLAQDLLLLEGLRELHNFLDVTVNLQD